MPGGGITVGLPLPVLWGDRASVTRAVGTPLLLAKASQCQSFKDQQSNSKSLDYKSCNFKKYTWGGSLLFSGAGAFEDLSCQLFQVGSSERLLIFLFLMKLRGLGFFEM